MALTKVTLRTLLDTALGQPTQNVVDFGLLKDFLLEFLIATNQADFVRRIPDETQESDFSLPHDIVRVQDEEADRRKEETGLSEVAMQNGKDINGEKVFYVDARRMATLEKQQESLQKDHDDLFQRVKDIQQFASNFHPLDHLPSGADLLLNKQNLADEAADVEERPALAANGNVVDEGGSSKDQYLHTSWNNVRVNKRLSTLEDGVGKLFSMLDILTAGHSELMNRNDKGKMNAEWLEKLEKEVEDIRNKLNSVTGQTEMDKVEEKLNGLESKLDKFEHMAKNISDLTSLHSELASKLNAIATRLNDIEAKHSADMSAIEANTLAAIVSRLNDIEAKHSADMSAIEANTLAAIVSRLNDIETKHSADMSAIEASNAVERQLMTGSNDVNDLDARLEEMRRLAKEVGGERVDRMIKVIGREIDDLKEKTSDFVSRQDIEDVVRWPALENALNARYPNEEEDGKKKEDLNWDEKERSFAMKAETNEWERETEEKDTIAVDNRSDQDVERDENHRDENQKDSLSDDDKEEKRKPNTPSHPSEEMRECLRRIGSLASLYQTLDTRLGSAFDGNSSNEDGIAKLQKEVDGLKETTESVNRIADQNGFLIDAIRTELNQVCERLARKKNDDSDDSVERENRFLIELDKLGDGMSMALNDLSSGVYSELKTKQNLIDALYECVGELQRNKVDINNAKSIFDLDAYKSALDAKVNMNELDELLFTLNNDLHDVLQRLDKYDTEEQCLKDAIDKLSSNMNEKLGTEAEKSLKKYIDSRTTQLQKSRDNLMSTTCEKIITNAAGFRRPLSTLFRCISCDRPVHLDGNRRLPLMSQRFPSKKGVLKSIQANNEDETTLNRLIENKSKRDPFAVDRSCGGLHTAYQQSPKKQMKTASSYRETELPPNAKETFEKRKSEKSIINFLLGSDGQVYRGRYKMSDLNRSKKEKIDSQGHIRSRSAEFQSPDKRNVAGSFSNPPSVVSSPRSLPPIDRDAFEVSSTNIKDRYATK